MPRTPFPDAKPPPFSCCVHGRLSNKVARSSSIMAPTCVRLRVKVRVRAKARVRVRVRVRVSRARERTETRSWLSEHVSRDSPPPFTSRAFLSFVHVLRSGCMGLTRTPCKTTREVSSHHNTTSRCRYIYRPVRTRAQATHCLHVSESVRCGWDVWCVSCRCCVCVCASSELC